ncbi:hypothetical protein CBR_g19000 [Chara braunii]|uniref:Ribosome biogenesis protein BOP1 homolog n=1 Tax=Chara braunii TaxID=69332 RepID=A0A388KX88_CHABU|nr:hypothetical protein CBR_g19000 [Chara braunii]|eukprot:GBG74592.1 hypothetical protein CBR_g19000 [Chara braunii]
MGRIAKRTRAAQDVAPPQPPAEAVCDDGRKTESDVEDHGDSDEDGLELSSDESVDTGDEDEHDSGDSSGDERGDASSSGESEEEREGGGKGDLSAEERERERESESESDVEEPDDEKDGLDVDVRDAVETYWRARERRAGTDVGGGRGEVDGDRGIDDNEEEEEAGKGDPVPHVQESDSSEDERPSRNTIGNVPLEWYKDEEHIGYDREGKKIIKQQRKDQLDTFLDRADDPKSWRKVYDEYNDEEITLTKEEIRIINRIRKGKIPHAEVNPYEPYVDWFDYKDGIHPLSNMPEPKRRFIPSKWEAKAVVKLVRAIRKGWIKEQKPKEAPKYYLLWEDDVQVSSKTVNGLAYIPPPKNKPPGHEESYNPPLEYLPTEEERNAYELMDDEDRPKFIPARFDSMRLVPSYGNFIKERFERCLDLYLCPRARKKRLNIDPKTLIPKLPKPKDLQPFPTQLFLEFLGHKAAVSAICTDPSGQWMASGSRDGTVRIWEVQTGRCRRVCDLGGEVRHVAWNPNPSLPILSVSIGNFLLLMNSGTGSKEVSESVDKLLTLVDKPPPRRSMENDDEGGEGGGKDSAAAAAAAASFVEWERLDLGGGVEGQALQIVHKYPVRSSSWHHKGDYFSTVAPDGLSRSVMVHQLSKQQTQNPFKKNQGRVARVLFHPTRPFFFVATKTHVRIYNLVKQQLAKKLITGVQSISSMDVHPGGDNLIIGSEDTKLCWFDMDLSTKPYRTLRYHKDAIRSVAFHRRYPLFASCGDDGSAHVFHGMVYSDLLQNPLIVPVKILKGHGIVNGQGVMDCVFHPTQPWLFTAAADNAIRLFCN